MNKIYDIIVIGMGVAGCNMAYNLKNRGQNVLLLDKSSVVATGGSGAAGAFVSPKIGKGSTLQTLTNEAFSFAVDFYKQNFSEHLSQTGVVRIPKDIEDNKKFDIYKDFNDTPYIHFTHNELRDNGINSEYNGFLFENAGVCDSIGLCNALVKNIDKASLTVENIIQKDNLWSIGRYMAKKVILTTGYKDNLLDIRYMGLRGTWGSRGDFKSSLKIPISIHKSISISANLNGTIKIGATHNKAKDPCLLCKNPLDELIEKASSLIDTKQLHLTKIFCGMRAGSKDYFPLVGGVVDTEYMLKTYPKITKGAKETLKKIDNLYILNGLGGRGFVFAPLMADILSNHIIHNQEIDKRINPDRLFLKWCRKKDNLS